LEVGGLMPLKLQILADIDYQWVGWCKTKLVALTDLRKRMNVPMLKKSYSLPNNTLAQIVSWDLCDIIRISGGAVSGFICHPRNTAYPGGIDFKNQPILPVYAYPLVDDDHGSFVVTSDDATPPNWTSLRDVENYGNLDWLGADTVVSWRGPSGRSFPMDSLVDYPGFTFFDYETGGDLPVSHYTPFSNLVYQSGDILYTFPDGYKVLGATDTYVIVGVDYSGKTNPDNGNGGFYTEVWLGTDKRIGWSHDSRPTAPWFFNQSGNEATTVNKKLIINTFDNSVVFSVLPSGTGSEVKTITDSTWSLDRSGSYYPYRDYQKNVLTNINLTILSDDKSNLIGDAKSLFTDIPILYSGVQATALIISGPEDYGGPGAYTAVLSPPGAGDCGDEIVWSWPTGCGMGTVSASKSGAYGSKQVRMPDGMWSAVSEETPCTGNVQWTSECISGDTKIDEFWTNSWGIDTGTGHFVCVNPCGGPLQCNDGIPHIETDEHGETVDDRDCPVVISRQIWRWTCL
jgi:hypothetical protein